METFLDAIPAADIFQREYLKAMRTDIHSGYSMSSDVVVAEVARCYANLESQFFYQKASSFW